MGNYSERLKKARELYGASKVCVDSGIGISTLQNLILNDDKQPSRKIRVSVDKYLKKVGL